MSGGAIAMVARVRVCVGLCDEPPREGRTAVCHASYDSHGGVLRMMCDGPSTLDSSASEIVRLFRADDSRLEAWV